MAVFDTSRMCGATMVFVFCLAMSGCGGGGGSSVDSASPQGSVSAFEGHYDSGDTESGATAESPAESFSGPVEGISSQDGTESGVAPTGPTSSYSSAKGDISNVPDLDVPDGVAVSVKDVRQAIADAAPSTKFPSEVSMSEPSSTSVKTTAGEVKTYRWRYSFGKGDAVVVASVVARVRGGSASEVTANVESVMSPSFDNADGSNIAESEANPTCDGIFFSGGYVKCEAVSDGKCGVEIGFVAEGRDLSGKGVLPTLTINDVVLAPMAVNGDSAANGGNVRASYRYAGDVPVDSGKVVVRWRGSVGECEIATSSVWDRIDFSKSSTDEIASDIASAVAHRAAFVHVSAMSSRGSVS